jgi:hypothetical protein
MSLRSLFVVVITLLAAPFAHGNNCQSIFSPYKVPPGFEQEVYDKTMLIYSTTARPFTEVQHAKPNSITTPLEKIHLVALIMSASKELIDNPSLLSQHLPERHRDTFEKLAALFISARHGNMNEIVGFLEQLLRDHKYEVWFEFVAKLHQSMQRMPYPPPIASEEIRISESIKDFYMKTGLSIQPDPKIDSYSRFTRPLPWSSKQSLTKHFIKRTQKDGYPMQHEQELMDAANNFILSSRQDQITFLRNDGTFALYDLSTKELAIVSANHRIITYYILSERYKKPEDLAAYMKYVFTEPPSRN